MASWVTCRLCGATDWALVYPARRAGGTDAREIYRCTATWYGPHPDIVRCRQCGLLFANPQEDPARRDSSYEEVQDPQYVEEEAGRVATFAEHLEAIEAVTRPARLLEVGCYTGVFLTLSRERGWQATGIEPSRWAAEVARRRAGVEVWPGTIRDVGPKLPSGLFDVVTLWDVIEHLADPLSDLREIQRLLAPGGMVFLSTFDMDSLAARVMGRRYPFLMDMHLTYFTRRTLEGLLGKAGFRDVRFRRYGKRLSVRYLIDRCSAGRPGLRRIGQAVARGVGLDGLLLRVPRAVGDTLCWARRQ